jgi:hypothetical protein
VFLNAKGAPIIRRHLGDGEVVDSGLDLAVPCHSARVGMSILFRDAKRLVMIKLHVTELVLLLGMQCN